MVVSLALREWMQPGEIPAASFMPDLWVKTEKPHYSHAMAGLQGLMGRLVRNYRCTRVPFTPTMPLHAVDVGASKGYSTISLLRGGGIVHPIGQWTPPEFAEFCDGFRRKDLFKNVLPINGRSIDISRIWPWQVDLVFLNVGSIPSEIIASIAAWSKFIKPGGIMAGFGINEPAVEQAVQSAIGFHGRCGGAIWFKEFEKKD